MTRRLLYFSSLFLLFGTSAVAQDLCTAAIVLCANNSTTGNTSGMGTTVGDPALSCGDAALNNNVWFQVIAINNGNCTVTVTNINNNPGLDMQVYTGTCGTLSPLLPIQCASGSSATGGSMAVTFPTTTGTTYFIMVDGNAGNGEAFTIVATTSNDAIVAKPDANFNTDPSSGCVPLPVLLQQTSVIHGGSNITYEWKIGAGTYVPATSSDSTVTFSSVGSQTVTLRVCNQQCQCKTVSQDVTVQDLFPVIGFTPTTGCLGSLISFNASATVLPDPPHVDANVSSWDWNFGDPASGGSNTASGQNVTHTFVGASTTYSVRLIVLGTCGPDTTYTTVNLLPRVTVQIFGPNEVCSGTAVSLGSIVNNGNLPIQYSWTGTGTFSCTNCTNPTITGLPNGGPYTETLSIIDTMGCTADTTIDITVNPLPTVFAGGFITVCRNDTAFLNAVAGAGTPGYHYQWSPVLGLSNDTIANPYTLNTAGTTYCVAVTDSKGCLSNSDCVNISNYPQPVVNPSSVNLCTTSPSLTNTFTVTGSAALSTYSWALSPSYFTITGAAPDSSSITATFPAIMATYNFRVIVHDALTGCIDTVSTSFTVDSGLTMNVSGPSFICLGDSATLVVSGATTYAWSAAPAYVFADATLATQIVMPPANTLFTITGTQGTCTQTITHMLNVSPHPVVSIAPIAPFCGCTNVTLNGVGSSPGMGYLWTSQNGNIVASPASLITSAFICANDSITLRVTDIASLCFSDSTVAATSKPNPPAQVNVVPNIICNGASTVITLDGTGSSTDPGTIYHWTSNNPLALITDTAAMSTTATVATGTIFSLTVTDITGCDSTASDTVLIYPPPIFAASPPFLCTSDPLLESTVSITGASIGSTYNWTTVPVCVTPGTTSSASQLFNFATCGTGTFNFDVTVTDPVTTCVTNLSTTVTVVAGVVLTVSNDTSFCEGGNAVLTVSGANTYLWNTGDTTSTVVISGLTAASSPYTYIVAGAVGTCNAVDTVIVTVDSIPATSPISGPTSVCENDPAASYSVLPTVGNYTWIVTGGTIVAGQGSNSLLVHWDSTGLATLSVVDTNAFGCPGTPQTLNIIVNPLPDTPIVTGTVVVCANSIQTYFVNPQAGSTYQWAVAGGSFVAGSTGTVIDIQWSSAGTGHTDVYEVTAAGCIGPAAVYNVTINPKPGSVGVSGSNLVCDNVREFYTLVSNPTSTFTWTVTNDIFDTLNAAMDSLTVDWGNAGVGNITVFETNSFGCNSDTASLVVNIIQHPQAFLTVDSASICNNAPYQIIASANTTNLVWHTDGNGVFSDTTIASPVYQSSTSDTGYVHLYLVASGSPCADDTARMVLYLSPSPTVTVTGPTVPICYGTSDSIRATGGGTYLWTPGGIPGPVIGITPLVTTTYTVSVTNSYSCTTLDSLTVNVIPPGIPDAGPDTAFCIDNAIVLTGSQQNAGGILWSTLGDGTFLPDNSSLTVTYAPGPTDTTVSSVKIILVTTGACINLTDTVDVSIHHLPSIFAGNDTTLTTDAGVPVVLPLAPVAVNVEGVYWVTSGTGTFSPSDTSLNAVYTPSTADFDLDSLLLTVTTTGSCNPVADQLVVDFSPFVVPNVFTPYPSSPGKNDFFVVKNLTPGCGLKIWDRWGELVYTSEYYQNDWDANGLKADVYYYLLVSEDRKYKGWVQVIRDE